jgi:hypothetical protein
MFQTIMLPPNSVPNTEKFYSSQTLKQQNNKRSHNAADRRLYSHQLQKFKPASAIIEINYLKGTINIKNVAPLAQNHCFVVMTFFG